MAPTTTEGHLDMSGNDDANDKYGLPLAFVRPLQYGNNIVVSLKGQVRQRKKSTEHFTEMSAIGMCL